MKSAVIAEIAYEVGFTIEHCDAFLVSCGNPYPSLMIHIYAPDDVFGYSIKWSGSLREWREFVYAIGTHNPSILLGVVHYLAHIRKFISSYGHRLALPH